MTLKAIKRLVYETECKKLIRMGCGFSEPIMTIDNEGRIIDNYFIFDTDFVSIRFSSPSFIFGIYSEQKDVAYVKFATRNDDFVVDKYGDSDSREEIGIAYKRYEELFPQVRDCVFKSCDEEQKNAVKEYLNCLELFSGELMWKTYKELFPSFFDWASSVIN